MSTKLFLNDGLDIEVGHRLPDSFPRFSHCIAQTMKKYDEDWLRIVDSKKIRKNMRTLRDRGTSMGEFRHASDVVTFGLVKACVERKVKTAKYAFSVRAGLAFQSAAIHYSSDTEVGFITQTRDERTLEVEANSAKLGSFVGTHAIVCDPMLASGGSAEQAIRMVIEAGATTVSLLSVCAAPQGIARISRIPEVVNIYTTRVEDGLNPAAFIVPGLGDFGDRLYGPVNE